MTNSTIKEAQKKLLQNISYKKHKEEQNINCDVYMKHIINNLEVKETSIPFPNEEI